MSALREFYENDARLARAIKACPVCKACGDYIQEATAIRDEDENLYHSECAGDYLKDDVWDKWLNDHEVIIK